MRAQLYQQGAHYTRPQAHRHIRSAIHQQGRRVNVRLQVSQGGHQNPVFVQEQ